MEDHQRSNTSEPKRYASRLRRNTLEEDQRKAYDGIRQFLDIDDSRFSKLDGKAGTGKTYLISVLLESILVEKTVGRIVVCAPTHKAVKVLEEQCDFYHDRLEFMTIHSLLGVEVVIDNWGQQVFKPSFEGSKVNKFSIVICDEYSMLADELVDALYEHKTVKTLFVGDINQIPPVGLSLTKVAKPEVIDYWKIREFTLTKIMRQAEGNPIISMSSNVINEDYANPHTDILEDGTGVEVISQDNDNADYLEDLLEQYFTSSFFREDSDFVKVVCWTNKVVNYMNAFIREKIYGEDSKQKIVIGERLIADKPIKEGKTILFTTNQEFEVNSFTIDTMRIGSGIDAIELKHYLITLDYYTNSNRLVSLPIKVLHEDSESDYKSIMDFLKDKAVNHSQHGVDRRAAWKSFYEFQELFAQVKYNYALTAHKSQGSTYKNTFVMMQDICNNPEPAERKKILYTAVTRAKHRLYLIT